MSSGPAARQKTAILLDGGFVYYRFAHTFKRRMVAADVPPLAQGLLDPRAEESFRIYFYDCAPNSHRATQDLIEGGPRALNSDDVEMNFTQKGIDMRIGLDVARREGVQVVLATLGATPHPTLLEHADFVRWAMPTVF